MATKLVNSNFLIGCDPEFAVLNSDNRLVDLECWEDNDQVGCDHGGRVGELRPEPTRGSYALTRRIGSLIREATQLAKEDEEEIAGGRWRAGAFVVDQPLGGHIHLGFPVRASDEDDGWCCEDCNGSYDSYYKNLGNKREENHALLVVDALDLLTKHLEGLDILPAKECQARRDDGDYGKYGEWRASDDDSHHLEYRTPPSWLYSPEVTFTILTGAKLCGVAPEVAKERLNHGRDPDWKNLVQFMADFQGKDDNARRWVEAFAGNRKALQSFDLEKDFRDSWKKLMF